MADKNPKASESSAEVEAKEAPKAKSKTADRATPAASDSKSSSSDNRPNRAKASGKKSGGFFKFLLFLIFLAALCAAGWYGYQYLEEQFDVRDSQLEVASQQVAELAQQISVTRQNQQNIERTLASFIGDQQRQMEALAERVRSSEGVREGDWVVAEAQYLLRLADQRLLISRDTESAAELLEAADALLRELSYPELVSVRQALAQDISSLRAAPSIDYQGLYFRILAAARSIDSLQMRGIEASELDRNTEDGLQEQNGIWASAVEAIKTTLADLVVVRKTTDSAEWLVDAEGEAALRGQVDLLILQSLSALLSGDQDIYSSALNSAADLVANNFEEGSQRDSIDQVLQSFADQQILTEVPDISTSLRSMEYAAELLRRINQGG